MTTPPTTRIAAATPPVEEKSDRVRGIDTSRVSILMLADTVEPSEEEAIAATDIVARRAAYEAARSHVPAGLGPQRSAPSNAAVVDADIPVDVRRVAAPPEASPTDVRDTPISTFGIDVDAASYGLVCRSVEQGVLPPREQVRIEELINAFDDDAPVQGGDPIAITTEVATCPWQSGNLLARIALRGRSVEQRVLPPATIVLLIDVSVSMAAPERLPLAQQALDTFIRSLRPVDRVALVTFSNTASFDLPLTQADDTATILGAIRRLTTLSGTDGEAGLRMAYSVANKYFDADAINHILLMTDGDFNAGETDVDAVVAIVRRLRTTGTTLTALGFGDAGYRDDLLERLADDGDGSYHFVKTVDDAVRTLVTDMSSTLLAVATDVKVQVEFNPATVETYRLIGYEDRSLARDDFANDSADAGDLGAGGHVTALYEITPRRTGRGEDAPRLSDAAVRYRAPRVDADPHVAAELFSVRLRYKERATERSRLLEHPVTGWITSLSAASTDFRFSAAVAETGLLLAGSHYAGTADYGRAAELARGALGADPGHRRAGFVDLVKRITGIAQR